MPMAPAPDDLASLSLADIARLAEERKLPPVEKWNPTHCGDSEMRIARDGTWYHEGSADRPPGDGAAVLDHPAPRAGRRLRAGHAGREARHRGRGRAVRRGRAEERRRRREPHASPSASTPAISSSPAPRPSPALRGRGRTPISRCATGLDALVARPVYYELAEIALAEGAAPPGRVERRRLLPAGAGAHEPRRHACARRSSSATARSPELIGGDVLDEEVDGDGITPAAVLVAVVDRPDPTRDPDAAARDDAQASGPGQLPRRPDRSRRRRPDRRRPARGRGGDRPAAGRGRGRSASPTATAPSPASR